jgi:ABC-type uncharacterized transport system substrate-binding protein
MQTLTRLLFAASLTSFAAPAFAHPHVWVTFKSELVYAADGSLTGIRQAWTFDDMYSVFATQGIDSKEKGKFSREELAPLAKENVTSLKEFDYFTFVTADGRKRELVDPSNSEYWADFDNSALTLHFILPLKEPVKAKELKVEVFDPSIFIDFAFAKDRPVKLVSAPACKMDVVPPRQMTFAEGKALSEIPADQPNTAMAWGAQFANKILVHCP